jgi:hypothetical protein
MFCEVPPERSWSISQLSLSGWCRSGEQSRRPPIGEGKGRMRERVAREGEEEGRE